MNPVLKKVMVVFILWSLLVALLLPIAAQNEVTCDVDHIVQKDDWLSKLADKFYGDIFAYNIIFEATNAKAATDNSYVTIADPNLIEVGWKLCIPSQDGSMTLPPETTTEATPTVTTVTAEETVEATPVSDDTTSQVNYPLPTTLTSAMPSDVVPPDGSAVPQDFYNFAWQEFIALNWPASDQAGIPDNSKSIADAGPRVWETWKNDNEIFLANNAVPAPWGVSWQPETSCQDADPEAKILSRITKFGSTDVISGTTGEATGYVVVTADGIDAEGNLTSNPPSFTNTIFSEVLVNEREFDYISSTQYYNVTTVKNAATAGDVNFPEGVYTPPPGVVTPTGISTLVGAVELKPAWRVLDPVKDAAILDRYYTSEAYVELNGKCTKSLVGLVGLHIIQKTTSHPSWIWATFEQVDNITPPGAGIDPTFTGPVGSVQTFSIGGAIRPDSAAIHELAAEINPQMQELLAGTPWQYYQLIGTQWTTDATTPPSDVLGNVALETDNITDNTIENIWDGKDTDWTQPSSNWSYPASTCIGCHGVGEQPFATGAGDQGYDFSYMLKFSTFR